MLWPSQEESEEEGKEKNTHVPRTCSLPSLTYRTGWSESESAFHFGSPEQNVAELRMKDNGTKVALKWLWKFIFYANQSMYPKVFDSLYPPSTPPLDKFITSHSFKILAIYLFHSKGQEDPQRTWARRRNSAQRWIEWNGFLPFRRRRTTAKSEGRRRRKAKQNTSLKDKGTLLLFLEIKSWRERWFLGANQQKHRIKCICGNRVLISLSRDPLLVTIFLLLHPPQSPPRALVLIITSNSQQVDWMLAGVSSEVNVKFHAPRDAVIASVYLVILIRRAAAAIPSRPVTLFWTTNALVSSG